MSHDLNQRAFQIAQNVASRGESLRIDVRSLSSGATVLDFGVHAEGGLQAGLELAQLCVSGLGDVALSAGSLDGSTWPLVQFSSDHPVAACLLSQYAGWQISVGEYFAMGSGPMRSTAVVEELFTKLDYRETSSCIVGILESAALPNEDVVQYVSDKSNAEMSDTVLCVAPTSSRAGTLQVVARSVETALHKLFEIGFDVARVSSAWGIAPLPPPSGEDLTAIGRTNDAILYGASVMLWVHGDDDTLAEIGPRVPACSSDCHGQPFLEVFEEAGRDFYKIDPHLFSPAQIVFQNLDTGRVHRFGREEPDVLRKSFGL